MFSLSLIEGKLHLIHERMYCPLIIGKRNIWYKGYSTDFWKDVFDKDIYQTPIFEEEEWLV